MSIGWKLRFEVLKRDGFRCVYCGATPEQRPLQVDHRVPIAAGGTDDPSNLVAACDRCNGGKSDVALDGTIVAAIARHQRRHGAASDPRCRTCASPRRVEIEARLAAGGSLREVEAWLIAQGHERIPFGGLHRHWRFHRQVAQAGQPAQQPAQRVEQSRMEPAQDSPQVEFMGRDLHKNPHNPNSRGTP